MSLEEARALLELYGYIVFFPLAIIEGPIVTVIAGFLITLGIFNFLPVYIIAVAGDVIGDALWYFAGRAGHGQLFSLAKKFFKVTEADIQKARQQLLDRRYSVLALSKFTWGIGGAGLIAAGAVRFPYPLFLSICFTFSLLQALVYVALGYFFGAAYQEIAQYLGYAAPMTLFIGIVAAFVMVWYLRKNTS